MESCSCTNKSNIDYLASENHIDGGRSRCLRLVLNKRDPFIGQKQGLKIQSEPLLLRI